MTVAEDRPISEQETSIVDWLLGNAAKQGPLWHLASGVPGLRVVGRCDCGCASVDFEKDGQSASAHPIADAVGETPAGLKVGVILWGRADAVTGLEVYELDVGSASALPPLESLKPWNAA
jgi:hypothetical protein